MHIKNMQSATGNCENGIARIKKAWNQGNLIYKLFKRKKKVGILLDCLRKSDSLTATGTVRLLTSAPGDPNDKSLQNFALNYYGLDKFMSIIRECLSGAIKPFFVYSGLREANEFSLFREIDATAQGLSLLLESLSLLVAGEESRKEAYLKGEGEVACWRDAAKRAKRIAQKAVALRRQSQQMPESEERSAWEDITQRIIARADNILSVPLAEARKDPRYEQVTHDPDDDITPTWAPLSYQVALCDDRASAEKFAEALKSAGLLDILQSFLVNIQ